MHRMTAHTAAVKALAWCPFQAKLLASGGGTADRSIKFWNTHTGALLNSIDTGSQVSAQHRSAVSDMRPCLGHAHMSWRQPVMARPKTLRLCSEKAHEAAQVCALQWSRHEKEILSSHGFSQNQLCLWKYPSMAKVCPLAPGTATAS